MLEYSESDSVEDEDEEEAEPRISNSSLRMIFFLVILHCCLAILGFVIEFIISC